MPHVRRFVQMRWLSAYLHPQCRYVEAGLLYSSQDGAAVRKHVDCVEDTHWLRSELPRLGLVAFVGNGSILPRHDLSAAPSWSRPFPTPISKRRLCSNADAGG